MLSLSFIRPLFILGLALAWLPAGAESIRLKDGSVLQGEVLGRTDSTLSFRSPTLGDIHIPLAALAVTTDTAVAGSPSIASKVEAPGEAKTDPADHALFFMPTAFTPAKGSFMFRDFELIFLTLGFAPTSTTTLTGGFLFPVSSEIQLLTVGFKQQLWSNAEQRIALALTGNATKPVGDFADDLGLLLNSNLVASFRKPRKDIGALDGLGAHVALGYLGVSTEEERESMVNGTWTRSTETDWNANFSFGLGGEARMTSNAKFMIEYLTAAPFDQDNEFEGGILTLGFRLHGARLAADIAGVRPITDGNFDGFFLWPLLVVSYRI